MSDWNPTDDELRAVIDASHPFAIYEEVQSLARLVLRERANTAEAYGKGQEVFRRRAEQAEAALAETWDEGFAAGAAHGWDHNEWYERGARRKDEPAEPTNPYRD